MELKINYMKNEFWKVATVVLIFLILGLSIVLYYQEQNYMDIDGVKFKKENFAAANEIMPIGPYVLCSFSQNKCVRLLKQTFGRET